MSNARIRRILRAVIDDMHVRRLLRVSHRRVNVQVTEMLDRLNLLLNADVLEVLTTKDNDSSFRREQRQVIETFRRELRELNTLRKGGSAEEAARESQKKASAP